MALENKKIDQLEAAAELTGDELLVILQDGTAKNVTLSTITALTNKTVNEALEGVY